MRVVGLDVHRDFRELAVVDNGVLRSAGRVSTTPEKLALLGRSLGADVVVVLEGTGNAVTIAALPRPHVRRVVLCEPAAVGDRGVKINKLEARSLAPLLASGFLREVWAPDEETVALRYRLSRRRQLVKQRTREKTRFTRCWCATSSRGRR
jgi:hypothetical protein